MKIEPIYIYKKWFRCPECTSEFSVYMTQAGFDVAVPPTCPNCGLTMKAENQIPPLLQRIVNLCKRARASWLLSDWGKAIDDVMAFDVSLPFQWVGRGASYLCQLVGWPIRKKPWGTYARATRLLEEQEQSMALARKTRIIDSQMKEAHKDLNRQLAELDNKASPEEEVIDAESTEGDDNYGKVSLEFENINRERKIRMATPVERLAMMLHQNAEAAFLHICPVCKIWWDSPKQAAVCARSHAMGEFK